LRTTALPTARLTTKPTRAGRAGQAGTARCTTRVRLPARRPDRTAVWKDAPSVSRSAADSTTRTWCGPEPAVRLPGSCGPCGGAKTGSRGRHGCACADGTRAPCDGGGCSAGTYACSRVSLHGGSWQSRRDGAMSCSTGRGWAFRLAPPSHDFAHRGDCSFVDMRHRSTPGDRATVRAGIPQGQTDVGQGGTSLWMTGCRRPPPVVTFAAAEVPRRPSYPPESAAPVTPATFAEKGL